MNESSPHAGPAPGRVSRRRFGQLLGGALLAATPLFATSGRALAGRVWCQTDPVLEIDGQEVDLVVSSYTEMNGAATGPTKIAVVLPAGSYGRVLAVDAGFGGLGYEIGFDNSRSPRAPFRFGVYQPAADNRLPVQVDLVPRGVGAVTEALSATGRANKWIVLVND